MVVKGFECQKGCKAGTIHLRQADCPYWKKKAPEAAPAESPAAPPPNSAPSSVSSRTTLPTQTTPVVKGGAALAIKTPPEQDFIVGKDRTRDFCNGVFRIAYWGTVQVDDFYEWKAHLPRDQFKLSENALDSMEFNPRNMYARGVTWFCKVFGRCKTLDQANRFLDSCLFLFDNLGLLGAIFVHYKTVYKESPKLKRSRAEKKAREEQLKRDQLTRQNAHEGEFRTVPPAIASPTGVPA